jgi:hypothetical protein
MMMIKKKPILNRILLVIELAVPGTTAIDAIPLGFMLEIAD